MIRIDATNKQEFQAEIDNLEKNNQFRAREVKNDYSGKYKVEAAGIEQTISDLATRIRSSNALSNEDKNSLLDTLKKRRSEIITHISVNGITNRLFLNIKQSGTAPAVICPAYNKMAVPTVSDYGQIGANIAVIRLDSTALKHIPESVLNTAGDLTGMEVDLFWTAIDGRFYKDPNAKPLNLSTHTWAAPHMLFSENEFQSDVEMGIVPILHVDKAEDAGAVAFGKLAPMSVHIHPTGVGKRQMLYSPDNAHFRIFSGSPFSIFWAVTKIDNRVAFTKTVIIFDYTHPLSAALVHSIQGREWQVIDRLADHVNEFDNLEREIDKIFHPICAYFENENSKDGLAAYLKLPQAFRIGIHAEVWKQFNSPCDIHHDFGGASFQNDLTLDKKYHCTDKQRINAILSYVHILKDQLIVSQRKLLIDSQVLERGDNVKNMFSCAEQIFTIPKNAAQYVEKLPEAKDVYYAFWELQGAEEKDSYNAEKFNKHYGPSDLIEAVLLAASRQTPKWNTKPLPIPTFKLEDEDLKKLLASMTIDEKKMDELEKPDPEAPLSTKERVLQEICTLVFDLEFINLLNDEKARRVNAILETVGTDTKNALYGEVWLLSQDPNKNKGDRWGEFHVADNSEILFEAINNILNK